MMKRIKSSVSKQLAWSLLCLFMVPRVMHAQEGIAMVIKVTGTVELNSYDINSVDSISVGTILFEEDLIRTGSDGSMIIALLSDKSVFRIKQNVWIQIYYSNEEGWLDFNVIDNTAVRSSFESTPSTSVASAKG